MIYYVSGLPYSDELYHFGIPGMKWYVRRYQNADGTLTAAGRKRYGYGDPKTGVNKANLRVDMTDSGTGNARSGAEAAKKAVSFVGKAAKTTGKAVGNAAKTVGKHRTEKFKRNHPWTMSDQELNDALERANKIDRLTRTRKDIRDRTMSGKMTNILINAMDRSTSNLFSEIATGMGRKFVNDKIDKEKEKRENRTYQLSNKLRKEFVKDFKENWKNGKVPTIDELENAESYLNTLRNIERPNNNGGGGKKKKKQ